MQTGHIALKTIGGQIVDRFAIEVDASLDTEFERATFLYGKRLANAVLTLPFRYRHILRTAETATRYVSRGSKKAVTALRDRRTRLSAP